MSPCCNSRPAFRARAQPAAVRCSRSVGVDWAHRSRRRARALASPHGVGAGPWRWWPPRRAGAGHAAVHAVAGRGERDENDDGRGSHGDISMRPVSALIGLLGKVQFWQVDRMEEMDRRIGARSVARLLGDWRPPDGRGLTDALADQVRLLVLDGRLPLHTRMPAERELAAALGVSRTTVAAAYEALRGAGMLHSRRGAGSWTRLDPRTPVAPGTPFSPAGTDAGHRPRPRRARRPDPGCSHGHRRGRHRPRRAARRARLRPARPPRAAGRARRPVHRARPADPARPGARHLRGAARVHAVLATLDGPGRPRARRAPDLPQRARRGARPRRPAGAGADGALARGAPERGISTCSPPRCATPRRG